MPLNFSIPEVDWAVLAPYAIMVITGILGLVVHMVRPKSKNDLLVAITVVGCVLAGVALANQLQSLTYFANGDMTVRDGFGTSMQLVILLSTLLCVLFSEPYLRHKNIAFAEFYPLVSWASVGAMIMVSTYNLLVMFVGLEILSVSLYVLAGLSRRETRSEEAAMKYFLLGAFASAFMLFGIAFIYGGTGTLDLERIGPTWFMMSATRPFILFGFAMIVLGLGFKASLVPLHQWTPDVYQGAPTNVTAFMATTAKFGAFGALWRVLSASIPLRSEWAPALVTIIILTMLVGNFAALTQRDVKRILAYSSIANAGYIMVGIVAGTALGPPSGSSVVYFALSYSLMTLGAFAVLSMAAKDGREATSVDDLRGLWQRSPLAAATLALCMVSLIGIPPTAGFFGKFLIFRDALSVGMTPLAIVLAVASAISIYYYLLVAFAAFASTGENVETRLAKPTPVMLAACSVCIVGILGLAIFFSPVMSVITSSGS